MPHPSKNDHHGCDGAKGTSWEEEDVQLHKCQILGLKINTMMIVYFCLHSLCLQSCSKVEARGEAKERKFWNFFFFFNSMRGGAVLDLIAR